MGSLVGDLNSTCGYSLALLFFSLALNGVVINGQLYFLKNRKHVSCFYRVLAEPYQYTNANAEIWLAELLIYYQPL